MLRIPGKYYAGNAEHGVLEKFQYPISHNPNQDKAAPEDGSVKHI